MLQLRMIIFLFLGFHLMLAEEMPRIDAELSKFLAQVNGNLSQLYNKELLANWQSEIKGPHDLVALIQSEIASAEIEKYIKNIRTKVLKFKRLKNEDDCLKRQLMRIPDIGYEVLDQEDLEKIYAITTNMSDIYRNVKLCAFKNRNQCNLTLIPDVQERVHSSNNLEEIDYYWLEWRKKTGFRTRSNFQNFVQLYRKTAKLHGFSKPSDFWFKNLGESSDEIMKIIDKILKSMRPLFEKFHAYVRQSLRNSYGHQRVPLNKPYPQNLAEIYIGEAFRESEFRQSMQLPYPRVGVPNITRSLIERGVKDAKRIYWNVEEFYRSLGMKSLPDDFWSENASPKSNFDDTYNTCWHKTWNFHGLTQQKLSYCTVVDEERFFDMFQTVSDIYYYRAYKDQPFLFQSEPIPNFSDTLGNVFRLSASSPRYLEKLKLFNRGVFTKKEARINRLYLQGLRTVFLLPVFYILDRYRSEVMDDKINVTDNCAFWKLTQQYTGASPPFMRSNNDFDVPAKLLIAVDDQYTSRSMSLGSSTSYKDVLGILINENELNIDGLLEYFRPLEDWLSLENKRRHSEMGWNATEVCTSD